VKSTFLRGQDFLSLCFNKAFKDPKTLGAQKMGVTDECYPRGYGLALRKPVKVAHRDSLKNKLSLKKFPVIWQPY